MATRVKKKYLQFNRFINGIADFEKEGVENSVAFSRHVDLRSDPRSIILLPRTAKESGSVVLDLPKWAERVDDDVYILGDSGYIYKRTLTQTYTNLRQIPSSHGNGLGYFGEDDFLYYTSDKVLGRYGPMDNDNETAIFTDDFLGSEGGIPTNTHSTHLESSSSQYFTRADSAALSQTSDITLEAYPRYESLPTAGNEMVMIAKWDELSDERSFKMSMYGIAAYFGDGSDGALTISSNTTDTPIDSACTGTIATTSLSATNASFAAGQIIMIHQSRGTGAGTWERNKILSYTAGTITLENPLKATYTSGAQVLVFKQYTNVTINSGITWTAKKWTGSVGGILAFLANGTVTNTGTINANGQDGTTGPTPGDGRGFDGGLGVILASVTAYSGEGSAGASAQQNSANGNGGGGAMSGANRFTGGGGGGGGNGTAGGYGTGHNGGYGGAGGAMSGTADLTSMVFGGGGGGAACWDGGVGGGGAGGGIIFISGVTVTNTGSIVANGGNGGQSATSGGAGGGGSILIKAQVATLGSGIITAIGGSGYVGLTDPPNLTRSGDGGTGRIHLDYYTSYTGTTSPNLDVVQDDLLTTDILTYQLRLYISSTGANSEILRYNLPSFQTGLWTHFATSWDASASLATFYVDGESVGTATGALTAIYNSTALFSIGADFDSSGVARSFHDGDMDEARYWSDIRTAIEILTNKDRELPSGSSNLIIYPQFDNNANDSSGNGLTLTAVNTPTYTTDVPFSAPTTRLDLDQSLDTSGNTYALTTSIAESATTYQEFVPAKDPQKSIEVLIAAVGSGDLTLTVHDSLNRVVATKTVTNVSLNTGDFEFVFSEAWRPVIGATYHFHLTSTVADGTVTTTTNADLNTVDFHTYYQFLVTDTAWHPVKQFLNFMAIGNERYLATWDASSYNPHRLTLPSGYRIRSISFWNEYLAIGTMRGSNIYDYEIGSVFFWDGFSDTYNFFIDVPEGGINALLGTSGTLHIWSGYQGSHLEYKGGTKAIKVKRVPKIEKDKYMEIYPGAVAMWQTLVHYGIAGSANSTEIQRGIYSWGSTNRLYSDALTFDHTISTGRYDNNVTIGMIYPVAGDLLIGWKDNISYGIDVVDMSASPYTDGTVEFPIYDYGFVWKEKDIQTIRADFDVLNSGETINVKYKLDREDNWNTGTAESTAGKQKTRLPLMGGRHKEVQLAVDLTTSVSTSPKVLSVAAEHSPLSEEEQF